MELVIRIKMNEKLFLKDPEQSELGRKIVKDGLKEINRLGFEAFTFKKLALAINTTEATIYRYFENKHKLLIYLIAWYWSFLEYKVIFHVNHIKDPKERLQKIIELIVYPGTDVVGSDYIDEKEACELIIWESSKAYLTRHVSEDNQDRLFKPYKDLCARFANLIMEYRPEYQYPHSLASTILEMAHAQKFFMKNLPSLTDFANATDDSPVCAFLEKLLFDSLAVVEEVETSK